MDSTRQAVATFGGGCFWCIEAVFGQLDGVHSVESGYMGGHVDNPTYEQICTGETGHAEVVQVTFEPERTSYEELLEWFFRSHDPTTLNRQGNDVGTQYRSVIFWHDVQQRAEADRFIQTLTAAKAFASRIVTELAQATTFWPAEDYHQDYYRNNRAQPYCRAIILPKLDKLGLDT